jgi:hypothetical protein
MQKSGYVDADRWVSGCGDVEMRMRRCGFGNADARMRECRCGCKDADAKMRMRIEGADADAENRVRRCGCGSDECGG